MPKDWWRGIKVAIKDKDALMKITPEKMVSYLAHCGYKREETMRHVKASVFAIGEQRVIVPEDDIMQDYVHRVADAIYCIAEATGKNELVIYEEIMKEKV